MVIIGDPLKRVARRELFQRGILKYLLITNGRIEFLCLKKSAGLQTSPQMAEILRICLKLT